MLILGLSYFAVTLVPPIPTADPLILLMPMFLLMFSFNYGRAAKTTLGREPYVSSSGPLHLKILSILVNGLLPVAAAMVLVAIASLTLNITKSEVSILPYPLSNIVSLYLQTRFGFVFFATVAAGLLLWIIKEFLEPVILYYSLNKTGAKKMISDKYNDLKVKLEKKFLKQKIGLPINVKKPSRGVIVVGTALIILLLGFYGPAPENMLERSEELVRAIPAEFNGENLTQTFSELADTVDSNVLRLENLIRYLVSIIWGG
jgi:hypothetical protein